jgi:hypothetical protein
MGDDKKSSPKRELSLCPKFTTKDSHTSLPRSRSHNRPTNPRNKPQTIPKRKQNSKSKGLSSSALDQADRPQAPGGPSVRPRRTIRGAAADRLKITPEPPVLHPQKRTVREGPADRPPCHGPSGTLIRTGRELHATKNHLLNGSNERHARTREEHDELLAESLLVDRPPGAHRPSVWCANSSSNSTS